jgi:hypothetical protein
MKKYYLHQEETNIINYKSGLNYDVNVPVLFIYLLLLIILMLCMLVIFS